MLLNELTGVKAHKDKTAYDILTMLKKEHGITITYGLYGMVLMNDSWDYVIKLFAKDDCYMNFVNYARAHPSKHFPEFKKPPMKMSAFFKGTGVNDVKLEKYYAVKVELLDPLDKKGPAHDAVDALTNMNFRRWYDEEDDKDLIIKKFFVDPDGERYLKYRSFFDVAHDLVKNCDRKGGCFPDLHEGNVMMRGDVLVIIDPYAAVHEPREATDKLFSRKELANLATQDVRKTVDTMADAFNHA